MDVINAASALNGGTVMQDEQSRLISLGMDLGVYSLAKMCAAKDFNWTPQQWERFSQKIAENIQDKTGMPAEDVELNVMPTVDAAMRAAWGKSE